VFRFARNLRGAVPVWLGGGRKPVHSRHSDIGPKALAVETMKPKPLLGLLFVLILLAQAFFFTSGSMTYSTGSGAPDKTQSSYGIGHPVTVTAVNGSTAYNIKWPALVGNLLSCYIFAAILSRGFTGATRFRQPAVVYGVVALGVIVAAFFAAIGISRAEWGYFFARPEVLEETDDITAVSAVIPVKTESDRKGHRRIVAQGDYSIADRLEYGKKDPYYCLAERVLLVLDERRLLPSRPSTDLAGLPALFPLVHGTGILAEPTEGYNDSDMLNGVVIDAVGKSGQRLVFLGLTGLQLSNDHYPYYELVFSGTKGSKALAYIRGQRFFFDVAGIEGAEWYLIWPFLALIGVIIGFLLVTAAMLIWREIQRIRKPQAPPAPSRFRIH
jgi:hypothetical protein